MVFFVNWIRDGKTARMALAHPTLESALDVAIEGTKIECSDIWVIDENGQKVADYAAVERYASKKQIMAMSPVKAVLPVIPDTAQWDVFISHASEDKENFVEPLTELLKSRGLTVWYDNNEMTIGDGLRSSIDRGLAKSRFGVVVLSHAYFRKQWPKWELEGLVAKEVRGQKVILPVWYKISRDEVEAQSPMLAGRLGANSDDGLQQVAEDILEAIKRDTDIAVTPSMKPHAELLALGPNIVCKGEILGVEQTEWRIRLDEFVEGDFGSLIRYIENFDNCKALDRYVLISALGDGRVLTSAPSMTKDGDRYFVRCPVAPSFPRTAAQNLGSDVAISPETGDMFIENGSIARVSGVAALPQRLKQCMSTMKGEVFFSRDFGSRLQEYYYKYRDTELLEPMLKLEVIRLAAIPFPDEVMNEQHVPLHCVERVWSIKLLAEQPEQDRMPILFDLEIKGLGRGNYEVPVLMPPPEAVPKMEIAKAG